MKYEIESATAFLKNFLKTTNSPSASLHKFVLTTDQVEKFNDTIKEHLLVQYENHWFPDKPNRGSGYRCIRINHKMDPLLTKAGRQCGIDNRSLQTMFPNELTLWIDPDEVSYRIGENGSICVLFDRKLNDNDVSPVVNNRQKSSSGHGSSHHHNGTSSLSSSPPNGSGHHNPHASPFDNNKHRNSMGAKHHNTPQQQQQQHHPQHHHQTSLNSHTGPNNMPFNNHQQMMPQMQQQQQQQQQHNGHNNFRSMGGGGGRGSPTNSTLSSSTSTMSSPSPSTSPDWCKGANERFSSPDNWNNQRGPIPMDKRLSPIPNGHNGHPSLMNPNPNNLNPGSFESMNGVPGAVFPAFNQMPGFYSSPLASGFRHPQHHHQHMSHHQSPHQPIQQFHH